MSSQRPRHLKLFASAISHSQAGKKLIAPQWPLWVQLHRKTTWRLLSESDQQMNENELEVQHQKSNCAWVLNKIRKSSWIAEWTRRHLHTIMLQPKTLSRRNYSRQFRGPSQTPVFRVTTVPSSHMVKLDLAKLSRFKAQPLWWTGKRP